MAHTAGGTQVVSALAFSTADTVLRMLGEYTIAPTTAPTALDRAILTMAIGVVSSDAFAVGASAVPDPASEPEYPWLFWASHALHFTGTSVDGGAAGISVRRSFDVRSMRKMKPRESLIWVSEYSDLAGAPPLTATAGITRVLLALP